MYRFGSSDPSEAKSAALQNDIVRLYLKSDQDLNDLMKNFRALSLLNLEMHTALSEVMTDRGYR